MNIEQSVTNGILERVDNYVLQVILQMMPDIKTDEIVTFKLGACPHCNKQRIFIEGSEKEDYVGERCVFCDNAIDETVLVYQHDIGKQLIFLKSEAEELMNKQ